MLDALLVACIVVSVGVSIVWVEEIVRGGDAPALDPPSPHDKLFHRLSCVVVGDGVLLGNVEQECAFFDC